MRVDDREATLGHPRDAAEVEAGQLEEPSDARAMRGERREAGEHLVVTARLPSERHGRDERHSRVTDQDPVGVPQRRNGDLVGRPEAHTLQRLQPAHRLHDRNRAQFLEAGAESRSFDQRGRASQPDAERAKLEWRDAGDHLGGGERTEPLGDAFAEPRTHATERVLRLGEGDELLDDRRGEGLPHRGYSTEPRAREATMELGHERMTTRDHVEVPRVLVEPREGHGIVDRALHLGIFEWTAREDLEAHVAGVAFFGEADGNWAHPSAQCKQLLAPRKLERKREGARARRSHDVRDCGERGLHASRSSTVDKRLWRSRERASPTDVMHRTTFRALMILPLLSQVWLFACEKGPPDLSAKPEPPVTTTSFRPIPSGSVPQQPPTIPAPSDVAAPPADATKTATGLASKALTPGTGKDHPAAEDTVKVNYTGWTTDGKMFDSSVTRGMPATFPLNGVIKGWTEGLQLMVTGEKRRFWIPKELAYNDAPGKPKGMLVFDVELLEIKQAPKPIPAPSDVAAVPGDAKKEKSGLASKLLTKGTGTAHPKATSEVEVNYTGWTTDGKMFDSSLTEGKPIKFVLNGVIAGWTEGVQLMVEGEKRRLWIPQDLAYKGQPGAPAGMLVFDVELLKITKP